jgi:hypothetical protein
VGRSGKHSAYSCVPKGWLWFEVELCSMYHSCYTYHDGVQLRHDFAFHPPSHTGKSSSLLDNLLHKDTWLGRKRTFEIYINHHVYFNSSFSTHQAFIATSAPAPKNSDPSRSNSSSYSSNMQLTSIVAWGAAFTSIASALQVNWSASTKNVLFFLGIWTIRRTF